MYIYLYLLGHINIAHLHSDLIYRRSIYITLVINLNLTYIRFILRRYLTTTSWTISQSRDLLRKTLGFYGYEDLLSLYLIYLTIKTDFFHSIYALYPLDIFWTKYIQRDAISTDYRLIDTSYKDRKMSARSGDLVDFLVIAILILILDLAIVVEYEDEDSDDEEVDQIA